MMACIVALKALKRECAVTVYSDSKYLVDGVSKGWAIKWRQNNLLGGLELCPDFTLSREGSRAFALKGRTHQAAVRKTQPWQRRTAR